MIQQNVNGIVQLIYVLWNYVMMQILHIIQMNCVINFKLEEHLVL